MTNPYYQAPETPVDFTVAKSAPIRAQFQAIEQGFDRLTGRTTYVEAGGTADALTATLDFPPVEYEDGFLIHLKIAATNTGPATLNVNGLGVEEIVGRAGDPLEAGDLVEGSIETMFYVDGRFMIRAVEGAQGPTGPVGDVEEAPIDGTAYARQDADWVPAPEGAPGEDGADGRTVLSGAGAPGGGTGIDGDFYINTSAWEIHGPKAAGVWPAGVDLIGAQGPQGIQGLTGPQGPQGATGPAGANGADGAGGSWDDLGSKPPELVSFAALTGVADKLPYFSGNDTLSLTDFTALGRQIVGAATLADLAGVTGVMNVAEVSLANPGYIRINVGTGLVFSIMWGTATAAGNGFTTVTYPDGGFSNFSVAVCSAPGKIDNNAQDNGPAVNSASTANFQVHNSYDNARTIQWIAVGR